MRWVLGLGAGVIAVACGGKTELRSASDAAGAPGSAGQSELPSGAAATSAGSAGAASADRGGAASAEAGSSGAADEEPASAGGPPVDATQGLVLENCLVTVTEQSSDSNLSFDLFASGNGAGAYEWSFQPLSDYAFSATQPATAADGLGTWWSLHIGFFGELPRLGGKYALGSADAVRASVALSHDNTFLPAFWEANKGYLLVVGTRNLNQPSAEVMVELVAVELELRAIDPNYGKGTFMLDGRCTGRIRLPFRSANDAP